MKINQFAHLKVDHQQKINELQKINFLDADACTLPLNDLYLHFLRCALIEAQVQVHLIKNYTHCSQPLIKT